ncbi:3-hydroxyacyl-CoA dehydrogenase [Pseudomonas veronii]|jgi:3-hydroxybutyryl-CoA dehydrogenase|uniref:3-hydroxyacyl-CoA dehydrogenase n=1 Tax=Pseudomonas veronii TaxID=76761 RepID=A0A7Y1ADK5_PSEVE|nr:3-hydroxyacyl-CoA dehydrogenase family protein [Pseudomonas veronii]NMY13632.1 3-hydroxyacyl-CoA dehydrogenase [Pseudomonas veronii]
MGHSILSRGVSRSFPTPHPVVEQASDDRDILVILGDQAGSAYAELADKTSYGLILIELGLECLGVHTGESRGTEGGNVLGFARYRQGRADPSPLVEVVRQPATPDEAIGRACHLFERCGLVTAVCSDFPGRIVDRLVRPYYNAALARLDAGLATADDMDLTLRLGLGYPKGPVELLDSTGLAEHYEVSQALYQALGDPAYAPARRAQVAFARRQR